MSRFEYWRESLSCILEEHGVELPLETVNAIAKDLVISAEMEGEAMGWHAIPNPLCSEVDKLRRQLADDRKTAEERQLVYAKHIAERFGGLGAVHVNVRHGRVEIDERR